MLTQETPKALRITLASPETIRAWSCGEVTQPLTLNYLTLKPEREGLLSEQIFGPVASWTCACGKYKRVRTPGFRCDVCNVEITDRSVRRERMGHIELAAPVAHPWFAKKTPSTLGLLLDLSPRKLGTVLSYATFLVLKIDDEQRTRLLAVPPDGGNEREADLFSTFASLRVGDLLEAPVYAGLSVLYGKAFCAESGAKAIRQRLLALNLDALAQELRGIIARNDQRKTKAIKRLQVVEALRASGVEPTWMILSVLPVLPPDLRPLVPMDGGRFASADLNTLYERILHRNHRLQQFLATGAPEIILNNERRLLQASVEALFDNGHQPKPVLGPQRQPLKSLTDMISGKQGRFRKNLLGKRVDYSGRSVIVGDPMLSLPQCGLPTKICLELFKPFLVRKLIERNFAATPRAAKRMIERPRLRPTALWDLLEEVMFEKVVLLNRAPSLHRLSIQAFEAKRVEGNAIHLHPLVCSAFNADFDGDQMAVHLPLSDDAQHEARSLMLSTRNLRNAATGEPSISVSQEMVLGLFYLTQDRPSRKRAGRVFSDAIEARIALEHGVIDLHTPIYVRVDDAVIHETTDRVTDRPKHRRIATTVGRLIFNDIVPDELRYRNDAMTKEALKLLVAKSLDRLGAERTAQFADALKRLGFTYATKSGISFAISDIEVPPEKQSLLARADAGAQAIEEDYRAGMITRDERYRQLIVHWTQATEQISRQVETCLNPWGSLATIIKSGATKAKFQQIRQLSGIRGLMARPSGEIIEIPIRGNYLEGLSVREAFVAASGARNGFMGRSLNTATTGYLTRKLVEAGMEVWITMVDCGTTDGLLITAEESRQAGLSSMHSRIHGRVLAEPVAGHAAGVLIDTEIAHAFIKNGVSAVRVRSVLCCQAPYGVCRHCYGSDLATGMVVSTAMAVGVIAGQSIGEPGTQLSMKAFHSGGIANAQGDIRQGLPRVIELFEARTPRPAVSLARCSGTVATEVDDEHGTTVVHIVPSDRGREDAWQCSVSATQKLAVEPGQWVEIGTPLALGALDLQDVLNVLGCEATARYLINEVQHVFRGTGVAIHDKHLECIVRQMLRYVQVGDTGDTTLLPGAIIDRFQFFSHNLQVWAQGGQPATARPVVFGLTKTVLHTSSWIAAASFQETSRVLMQAVLRGDRDPLIGLKERVVTGLRLPGGRPFPCAAGTIQLPTQAPAARPQMRQPREEAAQKKREEPAPKRLRVSGVTYDEMGIGG